MKITFFETASLLFVLLPARKFEFVILIQYPSFLYTFSCGFFLVTNSCIPAKLALHDSQRIQQCSVKNKMLGGARLKVCFTHEKSCFAYISSKYSTNNEQVIFRQNFLLLIQSLQWIPLKKLGYVFDLEIE